MEASIEQHQAHIPVPHHPAQSHLQPNPNQPSHPPPTHYLYPNPPHAPWIIASQPPAPHDPTGVLPHPHQAQQSQDHDDSVQVANVDDALELAQGDSQQLNVDEQPHEPEMMLADGQLLNVPGKAPGTALPASAVSSVARVSANGNAKGKEPARVSLADLKDCPPGVKPYHAYSTLIRYAIKGSPTGKLLLEDIYEALMLRFEYFRTAPPGWKNSVRHNLSLNPMFVKVERPLTDRGKGYYWTVRDEEGIDARTGVHRNRKKKQVAASIGPSAAGSARQTRQTAPAPYPQPYVIPDDGTVAALQAHFNPYPRDQLLPEVTEEGTIDWQTSWWNEITKLQQVTAQQEKEGVGPEWYRWMFEHIRAAFGHPAVIGTTNGTPIHVAQLPQDMAAPPPPPEENGGESQNE
ncbi:hypothetical protein FRB99_002764 [Tulasnella sp. 403]|nr:hypothetical protein FRB99_002764 [Tulasnella sp. 403]